MSNDKIWLSSPHMGGSEQKYVNETIANNELTLTGENIECFQNNLIKYTGAADAIVTNTRTAALHLAMIIMDIKAGDDVILSSFTRPDTIHPILYLNANPVLVDCEKETWNICPNQLQLAIQDCIRKGKRMPKAIIITHVYGMPAKLDEIMAIANKFEIPVIEDASDALGSAYKGKHLGNFGQCGVLSFHSDNIITTSKGGAIISTNAHIIAKAQKRIRHTLENIEMTFDYAMSNLTAALGRGQMEVLDDRVEQRRANNQFYNNLFNEIKGVEIHSEPNEHFFSNCNFSCITIDPQKNNKVNCEKVRLHLEGNSIEATRLWKPLHLQQIGEKCRYYGTGVSDYLYENGIALPSGSNITEEHKIQIKESLCSIFPMMKAESEPTTEKEEVESNVTASSEDAISEEEKLEELIELAMELEEDSFNIDEEEKNRENIEEYEEAASFELDTEDITSVETIKESTDENKNDIYVGIPESTQITIDKKRNEQETTIVADKIPEEKQELTETIDQTPSEEVHDENQGGTLTEVQEEKPKKASTDKKGPENTQLTLF